MGEIIQPLHDQVAQKWVKIFNRFHDQVAQKWVKIFNHLHDQVAQKWVKTTLYIFTTFKLSPVRF